MTNCLKITGRIIAALTLLALVSACSQSAIASGSFPVYGASNGTQAASGGLTIMDY